MSGALFETWVISKNLKAGGTQRWKLHFYRDKGKELNGLRVRDGTFCLEIKKTASPGKDDIRYFATLNRMGIPVGEGNVICLI